MSVTLYQYFGSNLKNLRKEIRNVSATPSQSNQLRNVNTIAWESRNITTQPAQVQHSYESYFLLLKKPALSEVHSQQVEIFIVTF